MHFSNRVWMGQTNCQVLEMILHLQRYNCHMKCSGKFSIQIFIKYSRVGYWTFSWFYSISKSGISYIFNFSSLLKSGILNNFHLLSNIEKWDIKNNLFNIEKRDIEYGDGTIVAQFPAGSLLSKSPGREMSLVPFIVICSLVFENGRRRW